MQRRGKGFSRLMAAALLVCCPLALALNPALDVSQYAHTSWKIRDGFPIGSVSPIVQSRDGYIWLGTGFGLFRYDGVRSTLWPPPPGQHLPSGNILSLLFAGDGTLWIGTFKGLASWKNGKLTQYPELAGDAVMSLIQDREGTVWAAGWAYIPPGKLCAMHNRSVQCYGDDGSLGNGPNILYEDRKGNLWAGTMTGVCRWKPGAHQFYSLAGDQDGIQALAEDDAGLLIALGSRVARLVNGKVEMAYANPPGVRRSIRLLRDRDGGLWIGTADAGIIHVHHGRTDTFSQIDGLSANAINTLFEDREGNVWVATHGGLDRFRDYAVVTLSAKQGLPNVSGDSVVAARDGSVWVGTTEGLAKWSRGAARRFTGRGLTAHCSLVEGQDGRLWVAGVDGLGYMKNDRFVRLSGVPGGLVYATAEDRDANLWIANLDRGLLQVRNGRVLQQIPWTKFGNRGFALALAADRSQGGVWLGLSEGGLAHFRNGEVAASYGAAEGLGKGAVNGLQFDHEGALWAATTSGLSRLKNGRISTLSSKNGLPCDTVHSVIEDDIWSLWLYMPCGLVRVARSDLDAWAANLHRTIRPMVLDSSDGLRTRGTYDNVGPNVAKSPDGKIWLTTLGGLSVFDPRHLSYNHLPPPVHIEQIVADRKTYDINRGLHLPPLVRNLTFDFIALSLVAPEKNRYRFKLEGWDSEWREAVNEFRVEYSNLPPRQYRFRVIACNNSGVWNKAGDTLDFSIDPAYYQTNWFRALCVLASLAMIWAAYRLRVQALENRQRVLVRHQGEITALNERMMKAQEEERMRIAGELHDGFLQQLTSLTLRMGSVALRLPADSEAKTKIKDLQAQMMQMGTELRHLSHELHPPALYDAGLPGALCAYCEEFSKVRGIPVSCEVDETISDLSRGAALVLYRIAQEALGNVAKHSQAKHAEVRLSRRDANVQLFVADDGIGFEPSEKTRTGLGLINMRERVHQLNGTFEFDSKPGLGTTVRAIVPFRPVS